MCGRQFFSTFRQIFFLKSLDKIIAACKKDKAWAQAELFERYSNKMFGTCLYYSDNEADAKDLLQDGFLQIFDNIKKYKSNNFEAWMRKVFINLALMHFRKQKRQINQAQSEFIENIKDNNASNNQMQTKDLMLLISELPTQYKMVFNLYAIEGYKHKEISEMLEISTSTSKSNLSRARSILQKKLKKIEY